MHFSFSCCLFFLVFIAFRTLLFFHFSFRFIYYCLCLFCLICYLGKSCKLIRLKYSDREKYFNCFKLIAITCCICNNFPIFHLAIVKNWNKLTSNWFFILKIISNDFEFITIVRLAVVNKIDCSCFIYG